MASRTSKAPSKAPSKPRARKVTTVEGLTKDQHDAYVSASNAAEAARAIGLDGKTQFRPRARAVIGHQRDFKSWAEYWTPANASALLADKSIARAIARKSS